MTLKALEFYSGIGGMHFSYERVGINVNVVKAFDINPAANTVYRLNFPSVEVVQRNIEALSQKYYEKSQADIWTMSPPCQPYTRQGHQKGSFDARSKSFLYLIELLGKLENKPKYILLENVAGFEKSDTREMFLNQLENCGYDFEEYLLNPLQFGYPNSRTRYYLLATKVSTKDEKIFVKREFKYTIKGVQMTTPAFNDVKADMEGDSKSTKQIADFEKAVWDERLAHSISEFLDDLDDKLFEKYAIKQQLLDSHGYVFDVVMPSSKRSCCFTKSYRHYNEGTGSVLQIEGIVGIDKQTEKNTRYFTEYEVAKLMGFPERFTFSNKVRPKNKPINSVQNENLEEKDDEYELVTLKQRYKLLGNSLSVIVVSHLMKHLLRNELENNSSSDQI
ncbi:hypothetical protein BB558_003835 [Smittium angustum]|uniref:tRNA (cytosine(38)-C(5))-methyltransferase n=1 Tax=Smittium angustum TaxID=133377 RepID=A0A2U1J587_SMIAN|nr:hypothetical protein BB558_003835 [Smittium angustum]